MTVTEHEYRPSTVRILQRLSLGFGGLLSLFVLPNLLGPSSSVFGKAALVIFPLGGAATLIQLALLRRRPALVISDSGVVCRLGALTDKRRMNWDEVSKVERFPRSRDAISLRGVSGGRLTLANRWFLPLGDADPDVARLVTDRVERHRQSPG